MRSRASAGDSLVVNQETGDFSEEFPHARAWQARKYDGGFGAIYFPRDVGGRGGTSMQNMIFMQEEARFDVPADQPLHDRQPRLLLAADEARQRRAAATS